MKYILTILTIMSLSQASTGQTSHAQDSYCGIISIDFEINAIPLYLYPDGIPFDVLKFEQKEIYGYTIYVIESNLGERFAPYKLKHAEESARQMQRNNDVLTTNNIWTRTHMKPQPIHGLSFKLIGNYDNEWLKIELNNSTRETCYIKRNDSCMHFASWEDIVKPALQVNFNGLTAYEKPNGKEMSIKEECKRGKILAIENEWMHIHYYYGFETGECWIKWKDESGMLVTNLIYEFIR